MPLASIRLKCLRLSATLSQGQPLADKRLVVRKHTTSSRALASRALQPLLPSAHKRSSCRGLTSLSGHMSHVQTVTSEFLSADELPPGTHLHLIVLNYILPQQTAQLWLRASTRICADGGANRLYDQIAEMLPGVDPLTARSSFLPDLIKGDLDSVRPDVQTFYTTRGVPMIDLSSDQETTDLEKCLLFLEGRLRSMSEIHIPVATATQEQQQQQQQRPEVALTVPAADAVTRNGVGHGAKAIGALNAAKIGPEGTIERSSTSNSSSTVVSVSQAIITDKGVAAGSSLAGGPAAGAGVQPALGVTGPASNTPQQQQQQQPLALHRHDHHQTQNSSDRQAHHQHQQHQQAVADVAAAYQPVSGRIVVNTLHGAAATHRQQAQQHGSASLQQSLHLQQQQEEEAAADTMGPTHLPDRRVEQSECLNGTTSPSTPSRSSSSRGVSEGGEGPTSSFSCGAAGHTEGGGGQQVSAAVLDSCEGPLEQASKRLQQDHVILVLGALGGRLDHTLSNLNTLYCYRHLNMTLWGDGNLVRLLRVGTSRIQPSRAEGPTCGLVPLARPATASSTGLKWNLDNTHMCFRGLLSTSNVIASDTITVSTDEDLLWITAVQDTAALKASGS